MEARLGPASLHPTSAQVRLRAPVLAVTLHTGRGSEVSGELATFY